MQKIYQFLFHNTRGAIRFEMILKERKLKYKIMPPPVVLDNCCGISYRVEISSGINMEELFIKDVREVYIYYNGKYELYYTSKSEEKNAIGVMREGKSKKL